MKPFLPRYPSPLIVALACVILGLTAAYALAQAPPSAEEVERRKAMGGYHPERMKNPHLTGHPGKMTVTAPEDIPLKSLQVPAGFQVELWAHGNPGARMMARGDKGTIFQGTRTIGRVYATMDKDGKRTSRIIAEKLVQPNGVLFHNGSLYVAAIHRVFRYDNIEASLAKGEVPTPVELTDAFRLPPEVHHNWKFLALGPDKKIYIQVGAPCNVCELNKEVHGQIRRYNLDGSGMEIAARGVRNSVGFDFHPKTGELWFTDNGRDWMGDAGPEDELNRVSKIGENFGFPYCHAKGVPDQDIKKADPCKGVTMPVALLGPHTAALGMRFYAGRMFPKQYQNTIFVARRGSWNRAKLAGFDVVNVRTTADGKSAKVTPFVTGFRDAKANSFWGRPVDVLVMPDGALLMTDEQNGAIYRISYSKK